MRVRRPSLPFGVTQTEPAPTATFQGLPDRRIGLPTTRSEPGSMRQTAGGSRVSAQTAPAPAAIDTGAAGSRIRAVIWPFACAALRPAGEDWRLVSPESEHPGSSIKQAAATATSALPSGRALG